MGLFAGAVRRARGTPEPELSAAGAARRGQHPRGETGLGLGAGWLLRAAAGITPCQRGSTFEAPQPGPAKAVSKEWGGTSLASNWCSLTAARGSRSFVSFSLG